MAKEYLMEELGDVIDQELRGRTDISPRLE